MPYKFRRNCPICGKRDLLYLSDHLRQVHGLSSEARQPWLKQASHHPPSVTIPMEQYPRSLPPSSYPVIALPDNKPPSTVVPINRPLSLVQCLTNNNRALSPVHCLETQPHPEFTFQHPYSMMVVGPSQCGKTHFVHQLLTHKCMTFPDKKPMRVYWLYNQWQPRYEEIQRDLQNKIRFVQGLPVLEDDLSDINPSKHTIIVLDDLMAQATDSPVVSKLFTQGRHRNASVILLLQNMFPKGKYNTDISRNATYKVLFRSPGDRKQIDIMAEQTFAKDRPRFMQAYRRETDRPYSYIVVDNHPRTTSEHQVVGDVFGDCYTYPHITSTSPPLHSRVEPLRESLPRLPEQPVTVTRKRPAPFITSKTCKAVPIKKRKLQKKSKKQVRKHPVHDSSDEKEAIAGPKNRAELEQNWLRYSELEDSDSEEGEEEEVNEEPDPREEGPREGETWNDYWHRLDWDRENSSSGTWHYPKNPLIVRPRQRGIGFGPRLVYP